MVFGTPEKYFLLKSHFLGKEFKKDYYSKRVSGSKVIGKFCKDQVVLALDANEIPVGTTFERGSNGFQRSSSC